MLVKLFSDTTPIDWQALGVRMPFAPIHELAQRYKLERMSVLCPIDYTKVTDQDIHRTFETSIFIPEDFKYHFLNRINTRIQNTMSALDQTTADTICINLGGGYHHAGKYPNTGYAYSLINDIIWAVDYQLEQGKTIGIIDLDFHFGGGTWAEYINNEHVFIYDSFHPKGVLQKHMHLEKSLVPDAVLTIPHVMDYTVDKYILNLGTDWFHDDPVFGKYGNMLSHDILVVWMETIQQIVDRKIPLAITFGGGYGEDGLSLYEHLIEWIRFYQPGTSVVL